MTRTEQAAEAEPAARFADSPNRLFRTRVRRVARLSPRFLRITLQGPSLDRFAWYGLDQRIKILLPAAGGHGLPEALDEDLLAECDWRRRWRQLPPSRRPALRSYTISGARPARSEVDIDLHLHQRPGPAARWAAEAAVGDRLLLSGPDASLGRRSRCVQWDPADAEAVWLGGDESAFPALAGILDALRTAPDGPRETTAVVEVDDGEDAAWMRDRLAQHAVDVVRRGPLTRGEVLHRSAAEWLRRRSSLGGLQTVYAWTAAESTSVAALRRRFRDAGLARRQIQAQGYWRADPPVHDFTAPSEGA